MTPAPEIGDVIGGKYQVARLRGEGGSGAVYEAENVLTGKRVALKWIRTTQATYEGVRERMLREAQSAARVRHRNVVDIYDVGFEEGVVYLVMELLEGETLAELMLTRAIPIASLIALLIPALRGVAAAHRSGVIHRDLKPENLFLASDPEHPEPRCVVLDFGVAKLSGSVALTTPGYAVGTPIFMPVEQLSGEGEVDARSDVHAVGVILYIALTGRSPYEGATLRELAMQMMTAEPAPLAQLRPGLPEALCSTVQRAMAKERSERPASIDALIAELAPFASADDEAWGGAGDLRTRIVPGDLGTPASRLAHTADAQDAVVKSAPARSRPEPGASTPRASVLPRARLDPSWWLAGAAFVGLAVALLWPSADPAPRPVAAVQAPTVDAAAAPEANLPSEPPQAAPPVEGPSAREPSGDAEPRAKKRRPRARAAPKPASVRALSVDEFAIED